MATKKPRDAKSPSIAEKTLAETENPPAASNGSPAMTKADMVRAGIAEGIEKPDDGVAFIKSRFGVDMPKAMWSSYKAQQKARDGGTTRIRTVPTTVGIPAGFGSDVREIRGLLEKLGGADEAKELIGQLTGLIGKYGSGGLGEIIDAIG